MHKAEWTKEKTQRVVTDIALKKKFQVEKIKKPKNLKKPKKKEPLTRKQTTHLHKALGQAHPDNIENVVKKTKMWDENTIKAIDDLIQCGVCAVGHSRLPRLRIAAPKVVSNSHILAIDIKENCSKLKAACSINKKGTTIAEHPVTECHREFRNQEHLHIFDRNAINEEITGDQNHTNPKQLQ